MSEREVGHGAGGDGRSPSIEATVAAVLMVLLKAPHLFGAAEFVLVATVLTALLAWVERGKLHRVDLLAYWRWDNYVADLDAERVFISNRVSRGCTARSTWATASGS